MQVSLDVAVSAETTGITGVGTTGEPSLSTTGLNPYATTSVAEVTTGLGSQTSTGGTQGESGASSLIFSFAIIFVVSLIV